MPEIGETLRETRMRRRIDMTEVEAATKIRAKYLRALENEEWDLLPGPPFVKTFLRTYAEYLDLDPRLLVEEYRQRYERPSTQDLTPFRTGLGGRRPPRGRRRRRPIGPFLVIGLGVVVLLGALYLLGIYGPEDEGTPPPNRSSAGTPVPTATPAPSSSKKKSKKKKKAPTRVTLRLTATDRVYVCVEDASNKPVVNAVTLEQGQKTKTLRSKRFRANFGSGAVRMTVDGKTYTAASTGRPVGYEMRPGKRPRRIPESVRVGLCAL